MTIFLLFGPDFIYDPAFLALLAVLLIGGGLLLAFLPGRAAEARRPPSRARKVFGLVLGVALILAGTSVFLVGIVAWAFHGYQEDAGTGTANTVVFGLVMFSLGIAMIAGGVNITRRVRRRAAPPPRPLI